MWTRATCYGDYVRVRPWSLMKQLAHRSPLVNPQDHVGQQRRDGNDGEFVTGQPAFFSGDRHRISHDDLSQHAFADAIARGIGQNGVGGAGDHVQRALLADEVRRANERAGGVDLVIHDDRVVAFHIADQVENFSARAVQRAPFLHDRQRHIEPLGEVARAAQRPDVRRDHDGIGDGTRLKVINEKSEGRQLVNGDGKKALKLLGVQVEGDDPVGACRLDQIGDQARRDRDARLILFVGAAIAVERHHDRDAARRVALQRVDEDQQLHQVIVDRRGGRLDQKNVLGTDALV